MHTWWNLFLERHDVCLLCCKEMLPFIMSYGSKTFAAHESVNPKAVIGNSPCSPSFLFNVLCQSPDPPLEGAPSPSSRLAPCRLAMTPPALPPPSLILCFSLSPHLFPCAPLGHQEPCQVSPRTRSLGPDTLLSQPLLRHDSCIIKSWTCLLAPREVVLESASRGEAGGEGAAGTGFRGRRLAQTLESSPY